VDGDHANLVRAENHSAGSLVNLSVERVFSTGISTRSPKR
jgi:hypothetical protein